VSRRAAWAALGGLGADVALLQEAGRPDPQWTDAVSGGVGGRVWWKVKARRTLDMLAIGFTGDLAAPTTLVLAFPGDVDDGQPVTAGSTTALSKAVGRSLQPLLHPTGESFERTFAWGSAGPTRVTVVAPFVVEVEADASAAEGVLRHAVRLHRARPDLDPAEAT